MADTLRGPTLERGQHDGGTLLAALHRTRREHGGSVEIVRDGDGAPLTYTRLLTGAYALGARLATRLAPDFQGEGSA